MERSLSGVGVHPLLNKLGKLHLVSLDCGFRRKNQIRIIFVVVCAYRNVQYISSKPIVLLGSLA